MDLSIVTTLYRSEPFLVEFHRRASDAARQLTDDYEIVLVNDGSPDGALSLALELRRGDPHVKIVDLSRNFGHHKAIMTGLSYARGKRVFLLDADLEEEPEHLLRFQSTMNETGADVVFGVQRSRKGSWFERASGALYYRLFNWLSYQPVTPNLVTARLMTRRYVDALLLHRERELCLSGVWALTGFEQLPVPIEKHCKGDTTYPLSRRIANFTDAITSFSNKPLVMVFYLGSLISLTAGTAALCLLVRRLFFGVYLDGWPSLIVSIWLLGGLTIFSIGVIGIYLSKIYMETKGRPYTIVRQVYGIDEDGK